MLEIFAEGRVRRRSGVDHVLPWREQRHLPNISFLCYEDLSSDFRRELAGIVSFLGYELSQDVPGRIEEVSRPFAPAIARVATLPGFDQRSAHNVVAELGADMEVFPSVQHLASWAGVCPGSNESGGKRKSGKTTKGSRWLRTALVQAAWAATCKKGSYFQAQSRRLAARRGKKRAILAVAHSLLTVIYHMLKNGSTYQELGGDYFDKLNKNRLLPYFVRRLKDLGYQVSLEAA